MASRDFPFAPCFHPNVIRNPYTGEKLLVPCGKCYACQVRKSGSRTLRVKLEAKSHKYCLFVTLTYRDEDIPRVSLERSYTSLSSDYDIRGYQKNRFLSTTSEIHQDDNLLSVGINLPEVNGNPSKYMSIIRRKQKLPSDLDGIAVLSKRDVQLFLKRLRKYVYKNTRERLRYFAVGEYGPKTYRPHYHVLLFFSSDKTYELLFPKPKEAFSSYKEWSDSFHRFPCWDYGRCDTQLARDAASYVSSYLNSSCNLPEIFKTSACGIFSLHSNFLGEDVLARQSQEIYENASFTALQRSIELGGKDVTVSPFKSYYSRLFPLCRGYVTASFQEKLDLYTFAARADVYLGRDISRSKQAEEITYNIINDCYDKHDRSISFFYDYILRLLPLDFSKLNSFDFEDYIDKYERKVYVTLLVSKRFLWICETFHKSHEQLVHIIDSFYSSKSLDQLRNFYQRQELDFSWSEASLWYDNLNDGVLKYDLLQKNPKYLAYRQKMTATFFRSVKHKKLNDLNGIFLSNLKNAMNG